MASPESDQDDIYDSWILNLQEFLDTLEPQIRDLSSTQILELLSNLEASDVNFHRYSFINQIKDSLEKEIGPLIQKLVDKQHHNSDNILVSDISENVVQSKQFLSVSNQITESIKMAAEDIAMHLSSDTFDFSEMPRSDTKNNFYYNDESLCSLSDGVDYMFMAPNKYKSLAKDIDPSNSLATRISAFSVLQQVPQTDLVASDAWKATRKGLMLALDDNEEEINLQALTFISRLFVSGSSHVVHEYFLILIENLFEYFNDDTSHMISIHTGLDLGDRRNILLLRKFRLLNQIQKELPTYWLRYSDKYVEEMTESLFQLLEISPTPISSTVGKNLMSPLHFLSLLDPQAIWFKYWMHGFYGRSNIFKCLSTKKEFLVKPVQCCLDFSKLLYSANNSEKLFDDEDYVSYTRDDITFLYFLNSLSILGRLILYKDGQQLFSAFPTNDANTNIKQILLAFLKTLKNYPLNSLNETRSLFHPVFLIVDIFRSLANSGKSTCQLLCDDDIYNSLVSPIHQLIDNPTNTNKSLINIIAEILTIMASTETGRLHLMYSNTEEMVSNKNAIIHVAGKALGKVLTLEMVDTVSGNTLRSFFSLCCEICTKHDGLLILQQYDLIEKMFVCFFEKQGKAQALLNKFHESYIEDEQNDKSVTGIDRSFSNAEYAAYKYAKKLEQALLENLLSLTMTPKGVELVTKAGGLNDCVLYMYNKYHLKEYVEKVEKLEYAVLLNQIAATIPGLLALEKTGYTTDLLQEAWHHLEGYSNDYTKTVLCETPEDLTNLVSKKLFSRMIELLSSFEAVQLLCSKPSYVSSDDEKRSKLQPDGIVNFSEFIEYLVLIHTAEKKTLLYHPDQSHFFALNVLHCLTASLDSMIMLETNYHFQEALLSMQMSVGGSNKVFIIDQCSLKRNQILVQVNLLGGGNERLVPPDNVTQDKMSPYSWTLFSSYPVPNMYMSKQLKSYVDQKQVNMKFKQLLDDVRNQDGGTEGFDPIKEFFILKVKSNELKMTNEYLPELLNLVVDRQVNKLKVNKQTPTDAMKRKLDEGSEVAIDMVVRYGLHLRLIHSKTESVEALRSLIQDCRFDNTSSGFNGFDWFAAIVFLLFSNTKISASQFLSKLTYHSMFIRPFRTDVSGTHIHPIFSTSCHYIELIVEKELPRVFAAFRLFGCPLSQICQHWLRQCFLNYLDWSEIVFYICACVLLDIDYQLYFTAAILKHMEEDILYYTQRDELLVHLKTTPIKDFCVHEHMEFMKELELKYRSLVLNDMRAVYTDNQVTAKLK